MSRLVLVLGCGPAGLIAAQAATMRFDYDVQIVSVKRPSQLYGCQYLHQPIPGTLSESQFPEVVNYTLVGTAEGYATKVYGPDFEGRLPSPPSPQLLPSEGDAWDLRDTYAELYKLYEPMIEDQRIDHSDVNAMVEHYKPSYVISSLPASALCFSREHDFKFTKCWAIGDAPELGQFAPLIAPPFTVVCDGTEDRGFYRAANVFGHSTVEWPGWRGKPPIGGVVEFLKPLWTDCNCWQGIHRVGRMGQWKKGVLSHEAYKSTVDYILAQQNQPAPINEANL